MNLYDFNPSLAALGLPDYTLGSRGLTPSFNSGGYTETPTGSFGPMSNRTATLAGGSVPAASGGSLTPVPMYANVPLPPSRPVGLGNSAGAGIQALHNNLTGGGSIPLPPPRPANLTVQPSANQLLQANASGQHDPGLIMRVISGLQGLGNGIGQVGQGISNGLNGIFSGLFGNNEAGA